MASDGLLFRCLAIVSPRFRTPLIATLLAGTFAAILALLLDLSELVHMMSIGTLLAFALVAVSVLILRYEYTEGEASEVPGVSTVLSSVPHSSFRWRDLVKPSALCPTPLTSRIANLATALMCILMVLMCTYRKLIYPHVHSLGWTVGVVTVLTVMILMCAMCIARQPQNTSHLYFQVPLVPVIPALSYLVNIFLMFELDTITWIRFAVWLLVGSCIYFGYGFWHSSLNVKGEEEAPLYVSFDSNSGPPPPSYMATACSPPPYTPDDADSKALNASNADGPAYASAYADSRATSTDNAHSMAHSTAKSVIRAHNADAPDADPTATNTGSTPTNARNRAYD